MGAEHTIAAGQSRTLTIPLQEDQAYDFTIGTQRFAGILDCQTRSAETETADLTTQTLAEPSPATVGGTAPDTNLAETGGTSATPDRRHGHSPGGDRRSGPAPAGTQGEHDGGVRTGLRDRSQRSRAQDRRPGSPSAEDAEVIVSELRLPSGARSHPEGTRQ